MAFTSSSVKVEPISVVGPRFASGGKRQANTRVYRVNVNQTIISGDIIVLASKKASKAANNADLATQTVVGVAAMDKTTGATVSEDDILTIWDAYLNFFEANLVTSETADEDMTDRTDWLVGRPLLFADLAPAATAGQWCVGVTSASNDDALIIGLSKTQRTFDHGDKTSPNLDVGHGITSNAKVGDKFPITGGHNGILNPRVVFQFRTVDPSIGPPAFS